MTAPPFVNRRASDGGTGGCACRSGSSHEGGLRRQPRPPQRERAWRSSVDFSCNVDGVSVLHVAACQGHLKVCKYLVEELGGDVNAPGVVTGAGGLSLTLSPFLKICSCHVLVWLYEVRGLLCFIANATPFMTSAHSGDVPTVEYFLDHGGDLMKADDKGRTVLHHAVATGCCKVTEFLISKGVPVDIDCGRGTPLYVAATNEQDKTLKGSIMTPLVFAMGLGGYTNFIQFLLKAGADLNIPDDMGRLQ